MNYPGVITLRLFGFSHVQIVSWRHGGPVGNLCKFCLQYPPQLRLSICRRPFQSRRLQPSGFRCNRSKITALTSIFGSEEPVRASCAISGEPFEHLTVFELLKLNYFALCIPFMLHARMQEIRAAHWAANGTLPAG